MSVTYPQPDPAQQSLSAAILPMGPYFFKYGQFGTDLSPSLISLAKWMVILF
jgi:hypothetical protein